MNIQRETPYRAALISLQPRQIWFTMAHGRVGTGANRSSNFTTLFFSSTMRLFLELGSTIQPLFGNRPLLYVALVTPFLEHPRFWFFFFLSLASFLFVRFDIKKKTVISVLKFTLISSKKIFAFTSTRYRFFIHWWINFFFLLDSIYL